MKSGDRLLKVLWLFSAEHPVLEVEQIARELRISLSTAYRYVGQLCESGFLAPMGSFGYALGPAIIELDRRIRLADPLVQSATPVLRRLLADVDPAATILLSRLYRNQVMCVAQALGPDARPGLSYERGRPMPLLRGAPSKAILAHLPSRAAERLWEAEGSPEEGDWKAFRAHLAKIRKAGVAVSHSEVDAGVVGIAACVFDPQGRPIGAVCTVLPNEAASPPMIARVSTLTRASADEVSATLFEQEASRQTLADQPPVQGANPSGRNEDHAASATRPTPGSRIH
jgi:DNA-binding IclR family transcriptional regulator